LFKVFVIPKDLIGVAYLNPYQLRLGPEDHLNNQESCRERADKRPEYQSCIKMFVLLNAVFVVVISGSAGDVDNAMQKSQQRRQWNKH
jgi:hypothetical protein